MFATHYKPNGCIPEQNSGERLADKSGYISAETRIKALINAGIRLKSARAEMYDFPDGKVDEDFQDPTRNPNYDMADAFQDNLKLSTRLKMQHAEASKIVQDELKKHEEGKDTPPSE